MANRQRERPKRSGVAARFDEVTLAAFTVLVIVTIAAVFVVGMATAEERIGCGLNDIVSVIMAYPRACR